MKEFKKEKPFLTGVSLSSFTDLLLFIQKNGVAIMWSEFCADLGLIGIKVDIR